MMDPLQNPDGRDRFVYYHREARGGFDQDHPLAADRLERWPGGRFNHYLFDMNRDWYLQTQQESAARVAAFLRWKPQIFVDAHEMGPDSTFFFDPSMEPYNPHTLGRQKDWHMKIGRTHADYFDRYGFAYTNREMFDGFGPQYGSTWPTLHGSIGILVGASRQRRGGSLPGRTKPSSTITTGSGIITSARWPRSMPPRRTVSRF